MIEIRNEDGIQWNVKVVYSKVKRPKLMVGVWGIVVVLPCGVNEHLAYDIIHRHRVWIERRFAEITEALRLSNSLNFIDRSDGEFKELVARIVDDAAGKVLGRNPFKVIVRTMKTRWASYSSRGTITLNKLLKRLPEYLISYIVYHEVCHSISHRHDERFWACLSRFYPNKGELDREILAYEIKLGMHRIVSP